MAPGTTGLDAQIAAIFAPEPAGTPGSRVESLRQLFFKPGSVPVWKFFKHLQQAPTTLKLEVIYDLDTVAREQAKPTASISAPDAPCSAGAREVAGIMSFLLLNTIQTCPSEHEKLKKLLEFWENVLISSEPLLRPLRNQPAACAPSYVPPTTPYARKPHDHFSAPPASGLKGSFEQTPLSYSAMPNSASQPTPLTASAPDALAPGTLYLSPPIRSIPPGPFSSPMFQNQWPSLGPSAPYAWQSAPLLPAGPRASLLGQSNNVPVWPQYSGMLANSVNGTLPAQHLIQNIPMPMQTYRGVSVCQPPGFAQVPNAAYVQYPALHPQQSYSRALPPSWGPPLVYSGCGVGPLPGAGQWTDFDDTIPRSHVMVLSRTLYVRYRQGVNCSESQLREIFSRYGNVQTCTVKVDRGFAFVKMLTRKEAMVAKKGLPESRDFGSFSVIGWAVGFGPSMYCNFSTGISEIPLKKLSRAERDKFSNAQSFPVIEEPGDG